jgi:hypothetical protein
MSEGDGPLSGAQRQAAYRRRRREAASRNADQLRHVTDQLAAARTEIDRLRVEVAGLTLRVQKLEATSQASRDARRRQQAELDWDVIQRYVTPRVKLDIPSRIMTALGLLGSEHQGERDAAAAAIEKWRAGTGRTWSDMLAGLSAPLQ